MIFLRNEKNATLAAEEFLALIYCMVSCAAKEFAVLKNTLT